MSALSPCEYERGEEEGCYGDEGGGELVAVELFSDDGRGNRHADEAESGHDGGVECDVHLLDEQGGDDRLNTAEGGAYQCEGASFINAESCDLLHLHSRLFGCKVDEGQRIDKAEYVDGKEEGIGVGCSGGVCIKLNKEGCAESEEGV